MLFSPLFWFAFPCQGSIVKWSITCQYCQSLHTPLVKKLAIMHFSVLLSSFSLLASRFLSSSCSTLINGWFLHFISHILSLTVLWAPMIPLNCSEFPLLFAEISSMHLLKTWSGLKWNLSKDPLRPVLSTLFNLAQLLRSFSDIRD